MREVPGATASHSKAALACAVAWMLVVQVTCLLGWDLEWVGRTEALVYWLLIGVLPPALALVQSEISAG